MINVERGIWVKIIVVAGILWALQATFSSLNTGLIQQYSGSEPRWLAIGIYSFSDAFSWWLMTPAILWFILRLTKMGWSVARQIIAQVIIAILIAGIQRLVGIVLSFNLIIWTEAVDLSLMKWSNFFGLNYVRYVVNGILTYFVITAVLYGYLYYIRSQRDQLQKFRLESELSKAKLENLKYQFQPHFLFNSLQSVSTLMHRDLKSADKALGDLGDLLRHSIKTIDVETTTIGEELLYLQKYLDLQKTRYTNKLTSHITFDKQLLDMRIPSFMLQPVVENSIKHGLELTGEPLNIKIHITQDNGQLILTCEDNNATEQLTQNPKSNGTGMANLKMRLQSLYGNGANVNLGWTDHGFKTVIKMPLIKREK